MPFRLLTCAYLFFLWSSAWRFRPPMWWRRTSPLLCHQQHLADEKKRQTNKIQSCGVHACKFPWLLLLFFKNYYFIVLWYFYKTKVQWQESGLSCNSPSGRFTSLSTSLPSHPPFPAPHYLLLGIRWWRFIGCYCVFVWLWKSGHQHLFFLIEVPSLSIGYD